MLRTRVKTGTFVPLKEPVSISGMEIPDGWSRAMVPPEERSVDIRCPAVPGVLEVAAQFLKLKSDPKSVAGGPHVRDQRAVQTWKKFLSCFHFLMWRGPGEHRDDRYDSRNQPIKPAVVVGNIKQACASKVRDFPCLKFLSLTTDFPRLWLSLQERQRFLFFLFKTVFSVFVTSMRSESVRSKAPLRVLTAYFFLV